MKKFVKKDTFLYFILFGVCIFILLQSPLAPFAKGVIGIDSSVFIYSAQQILKGQLMYRDIVDHKGPFLYFINVVALLISNKNYIGIWILEILSLFVTSIMMYKTARFFSGRILSLLAVVSSMLFLVICIGRGNLAEEWVLPYISIALYIFVDYLKGNKPLSIIRLFILSLTFVLAFMIRANLVAIWTGFGIVLLIKWIVEKRYGELIRNVLLILLFILLSLLPFFLYFHGTGTLSDAIYLVFKFNMFEYHSEYSMFMAILKTLLNISYIGIMIPVLIAIYMFFRDKTAVHGGVLLTLVITVWTCSLGYGFWHYYAIFTPLLVIPYSYIYATIKENISKRKPIFIFLFILFVSINTIFTGRQFMLIYRNYSDKSALGMEKLVKVITQNTEPSDKILVKGFQTSIYIYSDRECATRFPYPLFMSSIAKKYYVKDAEQALPKLILFYDRTPNDEFGMDSLINNRYQLLSVYSKYLEIWKLKE